MMLSLQRRLTARPRSTPTKPADLCRGASAPAASLSFLLCVHAASSWGHGLWDYAAVEKQPAHPLNCDQLPVCTCPRAAWLRPACTRSTGRSVARCQRPRSSWLWPLATVVQRFFQQHTPLHLMRIHTHVMQTPFPSIFPIIFH